VLSLQPAYEKLGLSANEQIKTSQRNWGSDSPGATGEPDDIRQGRGFFLASDEQALRQLAPTSRRRRPTSGVRLSGDNMHQNSRMAMAVAVLASALSRCGGSLKPVDRPLQSTCIP